MHWLVQWRLGLLNRRPPWLCKRLDMDSHPEHTLACTVAAEPVELLPASALHTPDMASHAEHVLACPVAPGAVEPAPASALQTSGHGQSFGAHFGL
jgi:hypothetical protein